MSLILRHVFCRLVSVGLREIYIRPGSDIRRYSSRLYQNHHSLVPNLRIQGLRAHRSVPDIRGDAGVVNAFAPTRLVRPLLFTTRGLCRAVLLELAIPSGFKQKSDTANAATVR